MAKLAPATRMHEPQTTTPEHKCTCREAVASPDLHLICKAVVHGCRFSIHAHKHSLTDHLLHKCIYCHIRSSRTTPNEMFLAARLGAASVSTLSGQSAHWLTELMKPSHTATQAIPCYLGIDISTNAPHAMVSQLA